MAVQDLSTLAISNVRKFMRAIDDQVHLVEQVCEILRTR